MSYSLKNTFACLPRTERGIPIVIGGDPKEQNFLYANGSSIIIRNIDNPEISDIYTEHSAQACVAKYSPSGFYIASADKSGKLRIWDTTQAEHILKNEFQPFVGVVRDLSWSHDNQRIVIVGEGRETFGHVINAETGTSVGSMMGHGKQINSCDLRPCRPFRIITGSEDTFVGIFEGPPFKFKQTLSDHTKFVQTVRFSPKGDKFATGGFDGHIFLYDAKTYEKLGQMGEKAHEGGVYGLSWNSDGTKLLSCSGDKTCCTWDVEKKEMICQFKMGTTIEDQQVSCLWQGKHLLSVSLSGYINYLDENNPEKPIRIIKGHAKPITSMMTSKDRSTLYTGGHDGLVIFWDVASGEMDVVRGIRHTNQVQDMFCSEDSIYTCGMDDFVRTIDTNTNSFTDNAIKMDSQPRGICVTPDSIVIVACINEVVVLKDGRRVSGVTLEYEATCISFCPQSNEVAVGGYQDKSVHVYSLDGTELSEKKVMAHRGPITEVVYSPDGKFLVASDGNRRVIVYDASSYEPAHKEDWCYHNAKVECLSWSPNSRYIASGSLDTNIIVWDVEDSTNKLILQQVHKMSQVNQVRWLDEKTIVSAGLDSNVKIWDLQLRS